MDYETVAPPEFGHALRANSVNLLCRDVIAEVAFLVASFGMQAHRASADFAIVLHMGQPLQLHSNGAYANHLLPSLMPESGPRGAGGVVLKGPTDKSPHGLREAVILSPSSCAFEPGRRI